eukprot:GFUD01025226.1.p1 GENE.GFUD01025226.1~~GFUD01025226.1.p1  ORF type:complete len:513 (+),score=147.08 GFUD01025226.1:108-1646(+)
MDHATSFLEESQVRICRNLQVNVLEKADSLLAKFQNIEMSSKLRQDRKLFIKPKVFINPLPKRWAEVGTFYDVGDSDFVDDILNKNASKKVVDIPEKGTSEDASHGLEKTVTEDKKDLSSEFLSLKDLLSDSEKRLSDRKMRITSLKINLANMEKKNAEKKLSIQKRDRRIKELEETMKIKEDGYKRFKELKGIRSKDNLRNMQESLEEKLLGLELELSKKNNKIRRLEEENKSLSKFKSWSRSLEKELADLKKNLNRPTHSKENTAIVTEKVSSKKTTNIFQDEIEIELDDTPDAVKEHSNANDETIESISSFLAELADTTDESLDLEKNISSSQITTEETSNPYNRKDRSLAKGKSTLKSVDNTSAWLALARPTTTVATSSAASAETSQKQQKTIQDYLVNQKKSRTADDDKDDTITTISDDEINVNIDGEVILLESMFEDHPSFSKDNVITIEEEPVESFLNLKSFASLCAKSDNIVEPQKRTRQVEKFGEIPSKRHKIDEYMRRAMEL